MKKISYKNLPAKIPLLPTMFVYMFMDYYNVPEWLWGIVGFISLILWGMAIYRIANEELVDIFADGKEDVKVGKRPTFEERLNEKMDRKGIPIK